jgi:tRNA wybutosine-synthesizing protein 4
MTRPERSSAHIEDFTTPTDLSLARRDIVRLGYVDDNHIDAFAPSTSSRDAGKHPPLVHRGYWARTAAVRALTNAFASSVGANRAFNVVNVGCGYDTIGLYVLDRHANARVVELDHDAVATTKRQKIAAASAEPSGDAYAILGCDIRDTEALTRAFDELPLAFDWSAPTLVIAECVLAYLPPGASVEVVRFFGHRARRGAFIAYDPIEPDDAFGRQMMRNVESRGCAFAGIRDAPNVDGARERFLTNGWRRAVALDMNQTYARLDPIDRARIERIERFDEFEEWTLIMAHYCLSYGVNDDVSDGFLVDFNL